MRQILAASLLLAVSACSHLAAPPVLTLGQRVCDAQPVLDGAVAVPFDQAGAVVKLGASSRCLQPSPTAPGVTYAVFRLPDAPQPYNVTVASVAADNAVVSPVLSVYGDDGSIRRTVPPAAFRAGVYGFETGLRAQPGDRILVVTADPASLGHQQTLRLSLRDQGGVQTAAAVIVPIIIFVPHVRPGLTQQDVTLALNGTIRVAATPVTRVP